MLGDRRILLPVSRLADAPCNLRDPISLYTAMSLCLLSD